VIIYILFLLGNKLIEYNNAMNEKINYVNKLLEEHEEDTNYI